MGNKCLGIIVLLFLVIAGGTYKFLFQGSVAESTDGRMSIRLDAGERDLVLTEMRQFLESIQKITEGITEADMQLVAEYARKSGRAAQGAVPGTLVGKLPMQFKKLGSDTHARFDQLALDAEEFGDGGHVLSQLSILMQNCVACHAAYRIDISSE
jgi:cytochrome c556